MKTRDKILAYDVELTGIEKGRVTGNLYELDYQKHYEHVKDASVTPRATKLIYENGERTQEADRRITGDADPDLGKFLNFEEHPKDPAALQNALRDEKHSQEHLKSGDIKAHIETLSGKGKEKKPSLRAQLAQGKKTVNTTPKKQAAMTAALPYMETEIQELAERTAAKLKKLTEDEFAGLVFLPAEDME